MEDPAKHNNTNGAIAEVSATFHSDNYNAIHIYSRNHPDYISWRKNNPKAARQYNNFRGRYWTQRANDFNTNE